MDREAVDISPEMMAYYPQANLKRPIVWDHDRFRFTIEEAEEIVRDLQKAIQVAKGHHRPVGIYDDEGKWIG